MALVLPYGIVASLMDVGLFTLSQLESHFLQLTKTLVVRKDVLHLILFLGGFGIAQVGTVVDFLHLHWFGYTVAV